MNKGKTLVAVLVLALLSGCAASGEKEYAKVYDRKYNEVRLVEKRDPGQLVGTSAVKTPARPPGQHP